MQLKLPSRSASGKLSQKCKMLRTDTELRSFSFLLFCFSRCVPQQSDGSPCKNKSACPSRCSSLCYSVTIKYSFMEKISLIPVGHLASSVWTCNSNWSFGRLNSTIAPSKKHREKRLCHLIHSRREKKRKKDVCSLSYRWVAFFFFFTLFKKLVDYSIFSFFLQLKFPPKH